MKILVTGGLGFIGSNFIRFLLSKCADIDIINIDNESYGSNRSSLQDIQNHPRYRFMREDISSAGRFSDLLSDVDVVLNIAAMSHVDRSIANPRPFFEANTLGTFALLEAIRRTETDPLFVQVGTDEVYGGLLTGSFDEKDSLNPSSSYAASKAAAEMFVLAYHRTYGVRTIISRCTNNFGPYQFPEKLIPKAIIRATTNMRVPIYGSGRQVRDWIYVIDHCEALDTLIRRGRPGGMYNIAGGNEIQNISLVENILEIMRRPRSLIEYVDDRPGHDTRYSLNTSKISEELSWKPRYKFKEALQATVRWYLRNQWWWAPLVDDRTIHPTPWKLKW